MTLLHVQDLSKLILTLLILQEPLGLFGASKTPLEEKIEEANIKQLHLSREWRKILFIPDKFYTSNESIVDDPRFFLSGKSSYTPEGELKATLEAFYQRRKITMENSDAKPAQCVLAARFHYLETNLNLIASKFPKEDCPGLDKFLHYAQYEKISMVFSNYYLNNPSSMFGHTFLRLHRKLDSSRKFKADLLDDAINFSAFITDSAFNPLYPLKGLIGSYYGRFTMVPFYTKIHEYNNHESRDLWEYELNLSDDEIKKLVLVLWEQGAFYSDYYFLDDNCALILLQLIEAGKPELQLTGLIPLYAIPADSVRALHKANVISKTSHRHSVLSRMMSRLSDLRKTELASLMQWQENLNDAPNLNFDKTCDKACQTRMLDAAIEFLDYKMAFSEGDDKVVFANLRPNLLVSRSTTGLTSSPYRKDPISSPIHEGHESAYVNIGFGSNYDNTPMASLRWKPALHALYSPPLGYGNGMEISFLETNIEADENMAWIRRLDLLKIISVPDQHLLVRPRSWAFDFAYDDSRACAENSSSDFCKRLAMKVVFGSNFDLFNDRLRVYGLVGGIYAANPIYRGLLSPFLQQGAILRLSSKVTIDQRLKIEWESEDEIRYWTRLRLGYAYDVNRDLSLIGVSEFNTSSWQLTTGYYF